MGLELGIRAVDGDGDVGVVADTAGALPPSLGPYRCRAAWAGFQQPKGIAVGWRLLCLQAHKLEVPENEHSAGATLSSTND